MNFFCKKMVRIQAALLLSSAMACILIPPKHWPGLEDSAAFQVQAQVFPYIDNMAPFNHTHMQRWVALQPVNHLLDMCVCQNLLISCLIYHKILQAVWASNLSGSITEDPAILGVMIGIIWRCSPLLRILTLVAHILQEIAHSATACHGGVEPVIQSLAFHLHPVEERTMDELSDVGIVFYCQISDSESESWQEQCAGKI